MRSLAGVITLAWAIVLLACPALARAGSPPPSLHPDRIEVSRWVDPKGRQPTPYHTWRQGQPPSIPFTAQPVLPKPAAPAAPGGGKVCVVVSMELYPQIEVAIEQYSTDLAAEGYTVTVAQTSGGTPENLRAWLRGLLGRTGVGCLLVGDVPVPWFEMEDDFFGEHAEFPSDLFYMDLDGQWTDADGDGLYDLHSAGSGDVGPEVWVGRLTASPLSGDEAIRVRDYFSKDHAYHTGSLFLPHRALSYVYDDWAGFAASDLDRVYGPNVTIMNILGQTSADDYRQRLAESHRFVHIMAHSSAFAHSFSDGWLESTEIEAIAPRASFYNLFACSNARYVESDYMGGHYIFAPGYGLAAVGSTKTGGMLAFDRFYEPLGQGKTLGEAFHAWFNSLAEDGFDHDEQMWYYGMTLLGDPTLTVVDPLAPRAGIHSPAAHERLHATAPVLGTAADAEFQHYTLEVGPGAAPTAWSTVAEGLQPVSDGTLGAWDAAALDGLYTLRLTVQAGGRQNEDRITAWVQNAEITAPHEDEILGPGPVSIVGTAVADGFQYFRLEYGAGEDPATWSTAGIALHGAGLAPVVGGELATFDTSPVSGAGLYTLRLTVQGGNGLAHHDQVRLTIDPTLHSGWPQSLLGSPGEAQVAVGDLEGDGHVELVAAEGATQHGGPAHLYAWRHDGTTVPGWPVSIAAGSRAGLPTLADLDRDGQLEVLAGSNEGQIYAWRYDGAAVAGWPQSTGSEYVSSPTVADLDGDGRLDVVSTAYDAHVHAWHGDGSPVAGWPQPTGAPIYAPPAVGDLDGDGLVEVVAVDRNGLVHAWRRDGKPMAGWPRSGAGAPLQAAPALGDLDGDGDAEIVTVGSQVAAWHHTGKMVAGWPRSLDGAWTTSSPALGDLDGDGRLEVVVGANGLRAWHGNGQPVAGWPLGLSCYANETSPIIANLDGDLDAEVAIGCSDGLVWAWHHNGSLLAGWPRPAQSPPAKIPRPGVPVAGTISIATSPVAADVDGDGDVEVASGLAGRVLLWDLPAGYDAERTPWPSQRHDAWHSGWHGLTGTNLAPLIERVQAHPSYVHPGSRVTIRARVWDEDGVNRVYAQVESPDETVRNAMMLYDDGAHDDGAAGDGVYAEGCSVDAGKREYLVDIYAYDGRERLSIRNNATGFTTLDVPYIQYSSHVIPYDSINHDGTANPGEMITLSLTLENSGALPAVEVSTTLTLDDPYVWCGPSGPVPFGTLQAGETAAQAQWGCYVDILAPHGHQAEFALQFRDAETHVWSDELLLEITDNVGPHLYVAQAIPDWLPAGSPVSLRASLGDGSGIKAVQAALESPPGTPFACLTLYDDGQHGDAYPGDGYLGNEWITDALPREVAVRITGTDGLSNTATYPEAAWFRTFVFTSTAQVLLVIDDDGTETDTLAGYYRAALEAVRVPFDLWAVGRLGPVTPEILDRYRHGVVIWSGATSQGLLLGATQAGLEAMLSSGGRLLVTSHDAASYLSCEAYHDCAGPGFLRDTLHAEFLQDDSGRRAVRGAGGNPVGGGLVLALSGGDGADNETSPDQIAARPPAVPALSYTVGLSETAAPPPPVGASTARQHPSSAATPESTAGLRVDGGDYRLVYVAFRFEAINSSVDRARLMHQVLDWLRAPSTPVAAFLAAPTSGTAPLPVVFYNLSGGPFERCAWSFGDGHSGSVCEDPRHTYAQPGDYAVTLTVSGPAGTDKQTRSGYIKIGGRFRLHLPVLLRTGGHER